MCKVHILPLPDEDVIEQLSLALNPTIELTSGVIDATRDYDFDILIAGFPTKVDLDASSSLRTLIIPWAGLSRKVARILSEFPHISVHNIHHNASAVAESALTLLLATAKRTLSFDAALRKGSWTSRFTDRNDAVFLGGKTALILGYGSIGQKVARLCQALGMNVLATRRSAPEQTIDGGIQIYAQDTMKDLLPRANVIIICLPLTTETEALLGEEELSSLPKGAILVNIARAKIVEEEALFCALESDHLFGAGLDVWYRYPKSEEARAYTMPSRFPFHTLSHVTLSPHRADHCGQNEVNRIKELTMLLDAAARGEEIPNRLSLERGY